MKIAAFQFKTSNSIEQNFLSIERGIKLAAEENVRFLITQECALCGYPPIESESISKINFVAINNALTKLKHLSLKNNVYVGVGTITQSCNDNFYNSVVLLTPDNNEMTYYNKRALWGWDKENYKQGSELGTYTIDGNKIGIRICYEVRFPEYFRELFKENVKIAFVSFCDVSNEPDKLRYELILSHLVTRAVENSMYIVTANSISKNQTAPTCIIDPDGNVLQKAPTNREHLLSCELGQEKSNFGREGRIIHSKELLGIKLELQ